MPMKGFAIWIVSLWHWFILLQGRKVLYNDDSKNYFATYGLTLDPPTGQAVQSKLSDLPKRTVAPSPNTQNEIALHQSIINPSPKSSLDEEENWVDQPRNLRKRKQDNEFSPVASLPPKKKQQLERHNSHASQSDFQKPSLKKVSYFSFPIIYSHILQVSTAKE